MLGTLGQTLNKGVNILSGCTLLGKCKLRIVSSYSHAYDIRATHIRRKLGYI